MSANTFKTRTAPDESSSLRDTTPPEDINRGQTPKLGAYCSQYGVFPFSCHEETPNTSKILDLPRLQLLRQARPDKLTESVLCV
jgi:hypothetical protein